MMKFALGDTVQEIKGNRRGMVIAIFTTPKGETRVVVEVAGAPHFYVPEEIEKPNGRR
jgi:hypothetical protein